jgi:DNA-binding beta-propeller fold protein YncE
MRYKMSQFFVKINIIKIFPILFFFSLLGAQWFEGNLYLPDSFSGTCGTEQMVWNSIDDRVYLLGDNETFVTIDGESDEKIQPIRTNGNARSNYDWFVWNGGNNCLYIWSNPYPSSYDSLLIVDCQTLQMITVIPFLKAHNLTQMCANPVSNKVYLIREFNHGQGDDTLIYAVDGYTHQIIKRIRFNTYDIYHPDYPSLKWNPVNNCLYVIGRTHDSDTTGLAVIDCTIDSIINFNPLPHYVQAEPNFFVLDSLRNRLYFSVEDTIGKGIYEFDCSLNNVIQRIYIPNPFHDDIDFALDPENSKIYYTNRNSEFIYVIDILSGTITDSIFVNQTVWYLSLYQSNHELYCTSGDTLSVIDLTTGTVSYYGLPDEKGVSVRPFLQPISGKLYLERGGVGEAIVVFDCLTKTVRKVIFNGTQDINDILLNPIEHKLYCANNYRPYIFIFNSETNQTIKQVQVAPQHYGLACFGFVPPHNKIYISYPHHFAVLDSRTDSVIKTIGGLTSYYLFAYSSIVDKLYTLCISSLYGAPISYVIDCRTDSIIKILNTTWSPDQEGDIEFDSLTNKVYMIGNVGGMCVIDCFNDSVIKRDTCVLRGDIHFRTHGDRRVYAGKGMYDRFNDSLIGYLPFAFSQFAQTEYNSIDDKLYVAQYPSDNNKIYVLDCNTSSISDSILGGMSGFVYGMFWNKLNNKLYFSPIDTHIWYQPVMVADCRTNEIVAIFPQIDRAHLKWERCLNLSNNRLYVGVGRGSRLGMIRDNIYGIEEIKNQRVELKVYPTLGRRFNIESEESIILKIYNALGEKVTEFSSEKKGIVIWDGKNSKGKVLSKGVYFMLIYPKSAIPGQSVNNEEAIKKVVLF